MQQGDVLLYQTLDDGDITVTNGLVEMSGGLDTAVYISLFGGNELDNGLDDNKFKWWGNYSETEQSRKITSECQYLLDTLIPIPSNLNRIQDACLQDLQWLLDDKIANSINISVTMPKRNYVKMVINITAEQGDIELKYEQNWIAK